MTKELNMTGQYKAELKNLKRNRGKVVKDAAVAARDRVKRVKAINREGEKSRRATDRALTTIDRRIAILEGRLS